MGVSRPWSEEDIKFLKDNPHLSSTETGRALGRSSKAIKHARNRHKAPFNARAIAPPPVEFPDHLIPEKINWREYLDVWEKQLDLMKRADPTQETLTIDMRRHKQPIAIVAASDLHLGGGFTQHEAIRETIEFILATPNMFIGLTGDSIEGFIPGVKPSETVEQQPSSVKAQLLAAESLVDELTEANKLLWWSWGDHDAKWFEQTIGINVVKRALQAKVPYFVGRGLATLKLNDQEYYLLINHSERFRSQWNLTHPSRRAYEQFFPADVVMVGHTHKPAWQVFWHYEMLRAAGHNLGGKSVLVQTGTFKTGPDPYTIRSWTRGVLGVPTMIFSPNDHDVDIFENPQKAATYLAAIIPRERL